MANIDNNAGMKDPDTITEGEVIGRASDTDNDGISGKVKVINNITGEILERQYNNIFEAKNVYQEISASESAFKRAKDKVKANIERFMAAYTEYEFPDGDRSYWTQPARKSIGYTDVAEALGEDVAALFSEVSVSKLEAYLEECLKNGEMTYEQKDALLSKVTVTAGKAFIKIGKAKR